MPADAGSRWLRSGGQEVLGYDTLSAEALDAAVEELTRDRSALSLVEVNREIEEFPSSPNFRYRCLKDSFRGVKNVP